MFMLWQSWHLNATPLLDARTMSTRNVLDTLGLIDFYAQLYFFCSQYRLVIIMIFTIVLER